MQIRVGAVDFDVSWEPLRSVGDCVGQCDRESAAIRIDDGLNAQPEFVTVWHEALHAILETMGILDAEQHDERFIEGVAHGVAQVLRDNEAMRTLDAWQEAKSG